MVSHTLSKMPSGHQVQHCQPLLKNPSTHFIESVRVSTYHIHKQEQDIHEEKKKKSTCFLCYLHCEYDYFPRTEKNNLYTTCSFYKQTTKYCWQQARYLRSRTSHTWKLNIFSLHSVKKNFHTILGEVAAFTSVLTIQIFLSCILA